MEKRTESFTKADLYLDCEQETRKLTGFIKSLAIEKFRRKGAVVAISGGIDSSVTAALAVKALGRQSVLLLMMPEKDSSPDTLRLSRLLADHLQAKTEYRDITSMLEAAGCYMERDNAIKSLIPEYNKQYKCKIVLPSLAEKQFLRIFNVVVQSPEGKEIEKRLTWETYLSIVAASNFKQRTRKMLEYFYADKYNYCVLGTPNRLEYDQGFFVKNGDGSADIMPIARLYKTQVYQLARFLGVPEEICSRPPTTDTYPLYQTQEEFYFSLPYELMDLCLYALNHGIPSHKVAAVAGIDASQVERVFQDIEQKRRTTDYQHLPPQILPEE
jgi:NAD+ synthase